MTSWSYSASLLDEEGQNEAKRLKDLGTKLLNGVDFDDLVGKEMVFAERMATPTFDEQQRGYGSAGSRMDLPRQLRRSSEEFRWNRRYSGDSNPGDL